MMYDNIFYEHTQRGNERPPTKKFSASPLIRNIVANPTTTKIQIATMTAMANPCCVICMERKKRGGD